MAHLPTQGTWVGTLIWDDSSRLRAAKPERWRAHVLYLLKPMRPEPVLRNMGSPHAAPQSSPHAAPKSSPRSPQAEAAAPSDGTQHSHKEQDDQKGRKKDGQPTWSKTSRGFSASFLSLVNKPLGGIKI